MNISTRTLILALTALIAVLTLHLLQTGAPQALVGDFRDAIGVHATMSELHDLETLTRSKLGEGEQLTRWLTDELTQAHDHWGSSYRFVAAASGIFIRSDGPDRTPGTTDDLEVRIRR